MGCCDLSFFGPVAMVCDLADRLASRGMKAPAVDDIGRICGPSEPIKLKDDDGSELVRGQMQQFLASVLRGRTVHELRDVCERVGMQVCGVKDDLVRRLAFQRNIEPCTPILKPRRRRSLGSLSPNEFVESPTLSPERLPREDPKKQLAEFPTSSTGCLQKVSRRRSIGVLPSVDMAHWVSRGQLKPDDGTETNERIADSSLHTVKKRRRMSI